MSPLWRIVEGDVLVRLREVEAESVACCVTSPPYWGLRDYGVNGQIGMESSPDEYVEVLRRVFAEVRRVLRPDGTVWLNLGDSYAGGKQRASGRNDGDRMYGEGVEIRGKTVRVSHGLSAKDRVGIPWKVAFALQNDGWILRSDIVWTKPNCIPESVKDRPTRSHEYIFLFTKSERYFYDADATKVPTTTKVPTRGEGYGRARGAAGKASDRDGGFAHDGWKNLRTDWSIPTKPFHGAHFATFPWELPKRCILAGSPAGSLVIDPFSGAATTGLVALYYGRRYLGIELNPEYAEMGRARIRQGEQYFAKSAADPSLSIVR